MGTTDARQGYRKASVGSFMLDDPIRPPYEDVDRLDTKGIKQDAAIRAVIALRKLGKDTDTDVRAAFDADPGIVVRAYQWTYKDALRKKSGRTRACGPRQALRRLDHEGTSDWIILRDPHSEKQFAEVEDEASSELQSMWHQGIEGLTLEQSRRVIETMQWIQQLKRSGCQRIPAALRQRVRRLRVETGLPLQIVLL